jgi:uncharacterized membrane protein YqgA involved in biofilm formation
LSAFGGAFLAVWALWEQQQRFSLGAVSFLWAVILGALAGYLLDRRLGASRKWMARRVIRGVSLSWLFLGLLWVAEGRDAVAVATVLEGTAFILFLLVPAIAWGE